MPFSHHSHSGEFCAHAKDKLETMVQTAIRKNMQVFALTEHMPRDQEQDLYPEEVQAGITVQDLSTRFDAFYAEARRLQDKYCEEITILVGMETEWIRPSSKAQIENILSTYELDILVGSVHHVYGIPIDFNAETYLQALDMAAQNARSLNAETEELLFADYFDAQLEMLEALKPPVVGHFDLIRLCSRRPNGSLKEYSRVWRKIMRNLLFIAEYGGLLEINSSALRKGLGHPYPALEICKRFAELNGRFVFSDDSHGVQQIGFGYDALLEYTQMFGLKKITIFEPSKTTVKDERFAGIATRDILIHNLRKHIFFAKPGRDSDHASNPYVWFQGQESQSPLLSGGASAASDS